MFGLLNRAFGLVTVRVAGADKERFLNLCAGCGAELSAVRYVDGITIEAALPARSRAAVLRCAEKAGCTAEILSVRGGARAGFFLRRRWMLALAMALLLAAVFASGTFIWEIEISGNETVPAAEILAALERSGVAVGKCWLGLTSDNVRSEVVYRLPSLAWITVNIYGSRAEVIVRERVEKPEMYNDTTPCDIVAEKSGFVTGVLALAGEPCVTRGQAVLEGERLISGGVSSAFSGPRALHAFGSVRALTYYELSAVTPRTVREKRYTGEERSLWSIEIFGKRINFYRNSSISYEECDKISSVWEAGIDGVFSLPVSVTRETLRFYEIEETPLDERAASAELERYLRGYLAASLREGEILTESYSASVSGENLSVCLRAECTEEIGRTAVMDEARLWEIKTLGK